MIGESYGGHDSAPALRSVISSSTPSRDTAYNGSPEVPNLKASNSQSKPWEPKARAVLIQGGLRSNESPLFLATAGIGQVAPYLSMPMLPNGRHIYALESPYIEYPEKHCEIVEEMASKLIESIRRIRPKGPYLLGGYSAGGVYAFEIARQLLEEGETVSGLAVIDMYLPQAVPAACDTNVKSIEQAEGGRNDLLVDNLTESHKLHMSATCRTLAKYDPKPLCRPVKTHLIWATEGLHGPNGSEVRASMGPIGRGLSARDMSRSQYETEVKSWFIGERYDFGTNGWDKYLGGQGNIVVHTVAASHYTIMEKPRVKEVGAIVLQFVDEMSKLEG